MVTEISDWEILFHFCDMILLRGISPTDISDLESESYSSLPHFAVECNVKALYFSGGNPVRGAHTRAALMPLIVGNKALT